MLCLFIVLYTALFRVVWCHFVILCIGVCVVIYSILYYIILFWYTLFTSFCDVLLYVPSVFIDTRSIVSFCYVFNYVAFVLCYLLFRFILYRNVLFCAFFFFLIGYVVLWIVFYYTMIYLILWYTIFFVCVVINILLCVVFIGMCCFISFCDKVYYVVLLYVVF